MAGVAHIHLADLILPWPGPVVSPPLLKAGAEPFADIASLRFAEYILSDTVGADPGQLPPDVPERIAEPVVLPAEPKRDALSDGVELPPQHIPIGRGRVCLVDEGGFFAVAEGNGLRGGQLHRRQIQRVGPKVAQTCTRTAAARNGATSRSCRLLLCANRSAGGSGSSSKGETTFIKIISRDCYWH